MTTFRDQLQGITPTGVEGTLALVCSFQALAGRNVAVP